MDLADWIEETLGERINGAAEKIEESYNFISDKTDNLIRNIQEKRKSLENNQEIDETHGESI